MMQVQHSDKTQLFTDLYTTYYQRLYRHIARLVGSHQAEDVTQEAFLKLWRFLCTHDVVPPITATFLYRIATNTAIDVLRAEKRQRTTTCALDENEEYISNSAIEMIGDIEEVRQALSHMKPDDAASLVEWACGFTMNEIAIRRNTSQGSLKARIFRTRHALEQSLQEAS